MVCYKVQLQNFRGNQTLKIMGKNSSARGSLRRFKKKNQIYAIQEALLLPRTPFGADAILCPLDS